MAPGSRKRSLSDAPPTKRTTFEVLTTTSNPPAFIFILPFLFLPTLSESLYPLFSASPTSSITLPFHLFIAFIAFTSYALVPLPRIIRWELHWIMLGMALVTSQAVVGIWGESFITLGVNGGAWMARLAVEGPATVLRWWCFMKMVGAKEQVSFSRHMGCKSLLRELTNGIIHFAERQKRSMRTLSVLAIVTYIASGYQPPSFYLVPECYIIFPAVLYIHLNAHLLLLLSFFQKYDYIIHDVFTGGSVPSSLFTTEFWSLTSRSLLPTGIVAVNFAGNITSLSSHLVLHTLLSSFPHCRAWEDGPPSGDFRNIVLLCSPNKERKVRMRNPVPVDFLPYPSPRIRKRVFETYKEFEIDLRGTDRTVPILGEKNKGILDRTLVSGAKEHWGIMKKVLRDEVWAKW
ncbi:hypothetical protein P7C70_g6917, partial [Phenoliferia sp. Uapishka_3]